MAIRFVNPKYITNKSGKPQSPKTFQIFFTFQRIRDELCHLGTNNRCCSTLTGRNTTHVWPYLAHKGQPQNEYNNKTQYHDQKTKLHGTGSGASVILSARCGVGIFFSNVKRTLHTSDYRPGNWRERWRGMVKNGGTDYEKIHYHTCRSIIYRLGLQ